MSGSGQPEITWAIYWDREARRNKSISAEDAAKYRDSPLTSRSAEMRRYFTPDGKIELTPVHTDQVVAHFRIKKDKNGIDPNSCLGVGESRRHYITKHVLAEINEAQLVFADARGDVYSTPILIRHSEVEMRVDNLRLDVGAIVEFPDPETARLFRSPLVAFEVRFEHATEEEKTQQLADAGISVLEIFLKEPLADTASCEEAEQFKERIRAKFSRCISAELLFAESTKERRQRQQLEQAEQRERELLTELDIASNIIQNLELTKRRIFNEIDQANTEKKRLAELLKSSEARLVELEREPSLSRFWRKLTKRD